MLPEFLQDRAALYLAGAMESAEAAEFEFLLECHAELREWVHDLAAVPVRLAQIPPCPSVPAPLRERVLGAIAASEQAEPEALVRTDPAGLIEWVNPAFTAMCGYELAEIRGRKPGSFLQGPDTDPAVVTRFRAAQRERRPVVETVWNYHRSGSRYRVRISLHPVLDDSGNVHCFLARERELGA